MGALIVFALPYEGFPPLVTQSVPLMVGVALLRRDAGAGSIVRGPTTAAGAPRRLRAPEEPALQRP
jgi:hypothetical protein